jgi:broad specificity phosphatase PhoE
MFVRHGQGFHNSEDNLTLFDAELTDQGISEAVKAGEAIVETSNKLGKWPNLVVVSPLTRTLQTATNLCKPLAAHNPTPLPMLAHEGCR